MLLVLVGSAALALLGAPAWIATTLTIGGVVGLGTPILMRAYQQRHTGRIADVDPNMPVRGGGRASRNGDPPEPPPKPPDPD